MERKIKMIRAEVVVRRHDKKVGNKTQFSRHNRYLVYKGKKGTRLVTTELGFSVPYIPSHFKAERNLAPDRLKSNEGNRIVFFDDLKALYAFADIHRPVLKARTIESRLNDKANKLAGVLSQRLNHHPTSSPYTQTVSHVLTTAGEMFPDFASEFSYVPAKTVLDAYNKAITMALSSRSKKYDYGFAGDAPMGGMQPPRQGFISPPQTMLCGN